MFSIGKFFFQSLCLIGLSGIYVQSQSDIDSKVTILLDITYDVSPPSDYSDYKVLLANIETGKSQRIFHRQEIMAGEYNLKIIQTGYKTIEKKILIPEARKYYIREILMSKKRPVSFNTPVRIRAVLVDSKSVSPYDCFKPGDYKVTVIFQEFNPIFLNLSIPPGEGCYYVGPLHVQRSQKYYFFLHPHYREMEIDGIRYDYDIIADGKKIDMLYTTYTEKISINQNHPRYPLFKICNCENHINPIQIERYYFVSPIGSISSFKISSAFYYRKFDAHLCLDASDTLKRITQFLELDRIDINRLLVHLESLTPHDGIERVRKILTNPEDLAKIRNLKSDEIEMIIGYLESLKSEPDQRIKLIQLLQRL